MKSLKDYVLSDNPKMVKKMDKILEKNPSTATYYEAMKSELASSGAIAELPGLGLCVTASYLVVYQMGLGANVNVFPISTITNLYRTNVSNGEYDFDNFYLGVEFDNGSRFDLARFPRSKKSLTQYDPIIDAVKSRKAAVGGNV